MVSQKIQEAIHKGGAELLVSVSEEIFLCELSSDLDRFDRLLHLFTAHLNYEFIKGLRDKGLDKEIGELADKAGKLCAKNG